MAKLKPIEETPFTVEQRRLIFEMSGVAAFCFVVIIVMAILGSREGSFHLISLEIGWGAKVWDALWLTFTGSIFFVLGGACFTLMEKEGQIGKG